MPQKALKAKKGRAAALADVDQTGCGAAVVVRGTTLRVGSSAFALGGPDDRATVGDWNCDGWVTPALLARSTGSLYRYDTWPAPGKPLAGVALGPIPHAVAVRAVSRDGCDDLLVTRDDGSSVVVSARPDPQSRGRTSP